MIIKIKKNPSQKENASIHLGRNLWLVRYDSVEEYKRFNKNG